MNVAIWYVVELTTDYLHTICTKSARLVEVGTTWRVCNISHQSDHIRVK
jgi:hypothetical protein